MNVTLNQLIVGFLIGVVILVLTVEKSKDFTRSKDRATLLISSMGALALLITIYDRKENIKRQLAADEYKVTMDDIANQRNNFLAPLKTYFLRIRNPSIFMVKCLITINLHSKLQKLPLILLNK